jgi:hypothetical protein
MLRLWEFFIHGCWHKWRARSLGNLVNRGSDIPYGTRYTYQCDKCHRIKILDVK